MGSNWKYTFGGVCGFAFGLFLHFGPAKNGPVSHFEHVMLGVSTIVAFATLFYMVYKIQEERVKRQSINKIAVKYGLEYNVERAKHIINEYGGPPFQYKIVTTDTGRWQSYEADFDTLRGIIAKKKMIKKFVRIDFLVTETRPLISDGHVVFRVILKIG